MKFKKPKRYVNKVFIHCSATDNPNHDNIEFIRSVHVDQNGWSDIGYHFFITKQGVIQTCRNLEKIPAAQRGHNTGSIAICLSGLSDFTGDQMEALTNLCHDIQAEYSENLVFKGHREVSNKLCPNFDYKYVLNLSDIGYLRERRKTLKQSRTVKGVKIAAGATILGEVAQTVNLPELAQQVSAGTAIASGLSSLAQISPYILGFIALVGLGYVLYARIDDQRRGLR